jgi:hypothetical protein
VTLWGGEERSVATHKCSATLIAHRLAEALLPPKGKGVRPHPAYEVGFPEAPPTPLASQRGSLKGGQTHSRALRQRDRRGGRIRHPVPPSLSPHPLPLKKGEGFPLRAKARQGTRGAGGKGMK